MQGFDINCYAGHWPFRKLRRGSVEAVRQLHTENGISGGLLSCLDSIFYNDPYEGDAALAQQMTENDFQLAATINPMLPACCEDALRSFQELNAKAVKLFPGVHGYDAGLQALHALCTLLQQQKIPLLLAMRMEDARLEYLFRAAPVILSDFACLAGQYPQLPVVLLGCNANEIAQLSDAYPDSSNLLFDISGVRNNEFVIERLVEQIGGKRLLYGSHAPLHCLQSSLLKLKDAKIPEITREDILYKNAKTYLGLQGQRA